MFKVKIEKWEKNVGRGMNEMSGSLFASRIDDDGGRDAIDVSGQSHQEFAKKGTFVQLVTKRKKPHQGGSTNTIITNWN